MVPRAHARFQFCSDPVRSHAYFPEWKPAAHAQIIQDEKSPVRSDVCFPGWKLAFRNDVTTRNARARPQPLTSVTNSQPVLPNVSQLRNAVLPTSDDHHRHLNNNPLELP